MAVILILAGLAFCTLFCFFPCIQSALTYSMAVIAALAVVFSGYYLAETAQITIQRDKVHRSFEFTRQLNQVDMASIRVFLDNELDHKVLSPNEFYEKIVADENEKLFTAVKVLLGIFEDASIAVQSDYVDERVLYRSLSFLVPWAAEKFHPYIEATRDKLGSKTLYSELDKLSTAWKGKVSLNTGQKI